MKYVKMFEAVVGLFPKLIKVTMFEEGTGNIIGKHKVPAEQLPAAFDRPTILEIAGMKWRVLKADPVSADDFFFSKKLILHVQNAVLIDERKFYHSVPTISQEIPAIGTLCLYNDFSLELNSNDWQQIEFRSLHNASMIEQEVVQISQILSDQPNALLGYQQQFTRAANSSTLNIPFYEFCEDVKTQKLGNIFLNNGGFVKNGFAIRSESYTYYGIMENERIQTLCITAFDFVDDEFMQIVNKYELLLVDWCNANVLSMVSNEGEPEVAIQI